MKRLFALLITIIMVASLAACGTNNSNTNENNSTNPPASSTGDNHQSGNESGNSNTSQNGNNAEAAKLTGKMNIINLDDRDPSVLRGVTIKGNQAGTTDGFNGKESSLTDVRCIFELNEWVSFYPDTDATYGLRVWILKHRDDQEYYNKAKFSDLDPNFANYCDLHYPEDSENPDETEWGSFYLNKEECEPGYYDFVFTYEGKAIATLLTRFYNENELTVKSDAELMEIMNGERNVSGGSTDADSENTQTSKPEADENTTDPGSTSTYNFPGYTTEGTWPDATAWAGMGLPDLPVSNAGKVSISDKEWIYPLNAKDGVLFEARPESSHFDELVAALNAAGIEGEDNSDSFDKYYEADYTYNGAQMDIKISEYDTGKLTILVRYEPEN